MEKTNNNIILKILIVPENYENNKDIKSISLINEELNIDWNLFSENNENNKISENYKKNIKIFIEIILKEKDLKIVSIKESEYKQKFPNKDNVFRKTIVHIIESLNKELKQIFDFYKKTLKNTEL